MFKFKPNLRVKFSLNLRFKSDNKQNTMTGGTNFWHEAATFYDIWTLSKNTMLTLIFLWFLTVFSAPELQLELPPSSVTLFFVTLILVKRLPTVESWFNLVSMVVQ